MTASLAGNRVFVCATPQPIPLASTVAYDVLTWVQIGGVGTMGAIGNAVNALAYPTWGDGVTRKLKGLSNAGDPTIEVIRLPSDPGQIILRDIAKTTADYAFRVIRADGTTYYNRGTVMGPSRPQGGNDDFDVEVFTIGYIDSEFYDPPTSSFVNWIFADDTWNDSKVWQDGRGW